MPATRQMFRFLSKGSKHRRATMGDHETIETERHRNHRGGKGMYVQQLDEPEDITNTTYADTDPAYDGTIPGPDPEGSTHSAHSITAKPTTATLAETFSSGLGEYSGVGSIDEGSSLLFDEERQYCEETAPEVYVGVGDDEDVYGQTYTEFDNRTREDDDLDTLDYTATVNDPNVVYEQDDVDAQHIRGNEFLLENGNAEEWEETSLGYETCSRTLNTNLEGVDYLRTGAVDHSQVYGVSSGYEGQPQYYYEDAQGQYQQAYADHQQYYDIDGNYVVDQYDGQYANQGHFFFDNNTVANSTIATGVDSHYHSATGVEDDADSAPIDAYDSEDSGSSWDEEGTRDMSLLDGGHANEADTFDDDDEESESESESDEDSRDNRRRGSKSMLQILQQMKHCSLKGSSVSYDDDQDYVPDVAQISTGATSMTSMTDSYESRSSSSYRRKQCKNKPRRHEKVSRNIDNLFNKVSALGQELLGDEEEERPRSSRKSKNKKKSLRRRDRDPATKIVDSLRDIFSCGHPRHY
eukprot:Nitzschia sp. Nitz4//scaffold115_size69933//29700//31268//NITZ4_006001-RA/size69933-processed-gene-0.66-mRNA-1//-1//CDS//3329533496//1683//frame0